MWPSPLHLQPVHAYNGVLPLMLFSTRHLTASHPQSSSTKHLKIRRLCDIAGAQQTATERAMNAAGTVTRGDLSGVTLSYFSCSMKLLIAPSAQVPVYPLVGRSLARLAPICPSLSGDAPSCSYQEDSTLTSTSIPCPSDKRPL